MGDTVESNLDKYGRMFKITFQNSQVTFMAPAELLSQNSLLFKDANSSEWQVDGIKEVLLEIGTPERFALFLLWAYRGVQSGCLKLHKAISIDAWKQEDGMRFVKNVDIWHRLLDTYLLGDYLRSSDFANAIMDNMSIFIEEFDDQVLKEQLTLTDTFFSIEERLKTIHRVWEQTSALSPLRCFVIDALLYSNTCLKDDFERIYTYERSKDPGEGNRLKVPVEFFWDFMSEALCDVKGRAGCGYTIWQPRPCRYHIHFD